VIPGKGNIVRAREKLAEDIGRKIAELNNERVGILLLSIKKKMQFQSCSGTDCTTCPLLDENIKQLEKLLVKMQLQLRI
jgi:hypothetical protein